MLDYGIENFENFSGQNEQVRKDGVLRTRVHNSAQPWHNMRW